MIGEDSPPFLPALFLLRKPHKEEVCICENPKTTTSSDC
jgi:hypothetical protein